MWKLWEFLLHGCWHEWAPLERGYLFDTKDRRIGDYYTYRCAKCHRIKDINVR